MYPSFTPTVVLFLAGTVAYGVLNYLQNEKLKNQKWIVHWNNPIFPNCKSRLLLWKAREHLYVSSVCTFSLSAFVVKRTFINWEYNKGIFMQGMLTILIGDLLRQLNMWPLKQLLKIEYLNMCNCFISVTCMNSLKAWHSYLFPFLPEKTMAQFTRNTIWQIGLITAWSCLYQ